MAWLVDTTTTALVNGSAKTVQKIEGFSLVIKRNADFPGNQTTSSFLPVDCIFRQARARGERRSHARLGNGDIWIFIQTFGDSP